MSRRALLLIVACILVGLALLVALTSSAIPWPWLAPPEEEEIADDRGVSGLRVETRNVVLFDGDELIGRTILTRGRVLDDATGSPVTGAWVTTRGGSLIRSQIQTSKTDALGEWRLRLFPNASETHRDGSLWETPHEVIAEAEGYAPESLQIRIAPHWSEQRVRPIRLTKAAGRLSVRVVDETGLLQRGAMVHLELPSVSRRYGVRRTTRTAATGLLGPIAIAPGRVIVRARARGRAEGVAETFVRPGEIRDVALTVVLPESNPATLRVVDKEGEPVPGVTIRLRSWSNESQRTDRKGEISIPLPRDGEDEVNVEDDTFICLERWISVRAGAETEVVVVRSAALEGRLVFEDGTPLPAGVRLWVSDDSIDRPHESLVGPNGRFDCRPLYPANVILWVTNGAFVLAQFPFELAPGENRNGLELRVEINHRITGTVRDAATNLPVPGVQVGAWDSARYSARGVVTDSEGRFVFPLVVEHLDERWEGSLGFAADGYALHVEKVKVQTTAVDVVLTPLEGMYAAEPDPPSAPPPNLVLTVVDGEGKPIEGAWLETADNNERIKTYILADEKGLITARGQENTWLHAPGRVSVRLPAPSGEMTIDLAPAAPVRVRVLDADGKPVPGTRVTSTGHSGHPGRVLTDAEGRCTIEGVRSGHLVQVVAESWAWAQAGGPEVVLRRPPIATVRIRLTKPVQADYLEICEFTSLVRVRTEGELLQPSVHEQRTASGFDVIIRAEPSVLAIKTEDGPRRFYTLNPKPGEVVELAYDPSPEAMGVIRIEDHRGVPLQRAHVQILAGRQGIGDVDKEGRVQVDEAEDGALGRMHLVIEADERDPVVVGPVDTREGTILRLPPMGRLSGRVTAGGRGVRARVRVLIETGVPCSWENTDASGRFQMGREIPEGYRRIEVRVEGRFPHFENVRIHGGGVTEVSVNLP